MLELNFQFHHVTGHQQETADCTLTLPEKLNIYCDSHTATLVLLPSNSPHCTNPLNDTGFPHLMIQNQVIIQWLQHTLQDAAMQQPYFDYLMESLIGPNHQHKQFTGQLFAACWNSLKQQSARHCRNLSTNGFPFRTATMYRAPWLTTYVLHVIKHLKPLNTFSHAPIQVDNKYGKNFTTYTINTRSRMHAVSNIFHEMLAYSLYQGQTAPMHLSFIHLPQDLHAMYLQQEWLGWKQLYYGHFTPLWPTLLQQYHLQINSTHYFAKVTTLIWQAVLKIWKMHTPR